MVKVQCVEFAFNFGLLFPLIPYASFTKHYLLILVFPRKDQCENKIMGTTVIRLNNSSERSKEQYCAL